MNETKGENVVSIEVVQFVDRSIDTERRLMECELEKAKAETMVLKELIFERFRSEKVAVELAQTELHRRLEDLNHAHENMVKDRQRFLPRESHEAFLKDFDVWRSTINTFRDNLTGKIAVSVFLAGIAMAIVFHYWR